MAAGIDDDAAKAVASGRETVGALLRTAQKRLQKVFIAFVVVYDGFFFSLLVRKLRRYRRAYEETDAAAYYEGDTDLKSAVRRID